MFCRCTAKCRIICCIKWRTINARTYMELRNAFLKSFSSRQGSPRFWALLVAAQRAHPQPLAAVQPGQMCRSAKRLFAFCAQIPLILQNASSASNALQADLLCLAGRTWHVTRQLSRGVATENLKGMLVVTIDRRHVFSQGIQKHACGWERKLFWHPLRVFCTSKLRWGVPTTAVLRARMAGGCVRQSQAAAAPKGSILPDGACA